MSALTKAQLGEITSGDNPAEVPGTLVDVQFNPTSLRVQISNRTAGGQQAGAQARQRPGTGEMQVSFDLVFDTADEGTTEQPANVLDKTKMVERFVRPKGARAGQEAPPRVIFKWGGFLVQGTMESANIDLDLFDAKGVPLRAKVAVTIKGQDPRWTYTPAPNPQPAGSGASPAGNGAGTGLPPGAPGTQGSRQSPDRIMQAMPGESLAQLAQRAGLDPKAWRALADGLANPLKLELGQEVPLPTSTARGAASAAGSQDPGKAAAGLPLVDAGEAGRSGAGSNDGERNRGGRATDPVRKGQAVVTRGGLRGAIEAVKGEAHQEGAVASLIGFGVASHATAENGGRPWGAGVPLRPRFGSAVAGTRRDPTQAAWIVQQVVPAAASARVATTIRPTGGGAAAATGGCGCRGRKSRPVR